MPELEQSEVFERIFQHEKTTVGSATSRWYGNTIAEKLIRRALLRDLSHSCMGQAGRPAAECSLHSEGFEIPRVLELRSGEFLIAIVRPTTDNHAMPNVTIIHRSFELNDRETARAVVDLVTLEFMNGLECPVSVFADGSLASKVYHHGTPWLLPYKRYVAAPMSRILGERCLDTDIALELSIPRDLSFYPAYSQMYEEFWFHRPGLRSHVRMESEEAMANYLHEGALRLVIIDDELAGVVAAARESEFGLAGWCIHERILWKRWWGKRIGRAMIWRFAQKLQYSDTDSIWGTIIGENQASFKSAMATGREDIGGLFWIDHDGGLGERTGLVI